MSNNKQSIKLYTEEQVKKIQYAILCNHKDAIMDANYCLNVTTPIELPSDEEIIHSASDWVFRKNPTKWSVNDDTAGDNMGSFLNGARWFKNKIQGGNNEQQ